MRLSDSVSTCLLTTFSLLHIASASTEAPKAVAFPFTKRIAPTVPVARLRRRAIKAVDVDIYDAQNHLLFLVNVTVGEPPQSFSLQLDTGSSDIWLPWARSSQCLKFNVCTNGAYDPGASSTYKNIARGDFQIAYVDGTEIAGDYITDTFGIGDATVKNMTMGVATQAIVNCEGCPFQGIVGVGYPAGESIAHTDGPGAIYPNLINQLKNQGYIRSLAYSLWLNDLESELGEILFGAIDRKKYSGDLVSLPVQPETEFNAGSRMSHALTSFNVVLDNFNVANGKGDLQYEKKNMALPVILDSGTTLTYLPDSIALEIARGVGATNDPDYGLVVPCSLRDSPATLNFGFGNANGPVIRAEISQFVLPFPDGYPAPRFRSGATACNWGILGSGSDPNLFGDTFLRSAYVVYDMEHNQVAIAQTVFNVTDSDVVEIVSGIPDVASTASGVQVTQTATGNGPYGTNVRTKSLTATGSATVSASGFDLGPETSGSSTSGVPATTGTGIVGGPLDPPAEGAGARMAPRTLTLSSVATVLSVVVGMMAGGSLLIWS